MWGEERLGLRWEVEQIVIIKGLLSRTTDSLIDWLIEKDDIKKLKWKEYKVNYGLIMFDQECF